MNSADDRLLRALWTRNTPPSDEERKRVFVTMSKLMGEIERIIGQPFRMQPLGEEAPQTARELRDLLRLHALVFSCIRSVPTEIWQRIFFFVACDFSGFLQGDIYLRNICNVAHHWRTAATGHPSLWTILPTTFLHSHQRTHKCLTPFPKIESQLNLIKLYLKRSGTLPIRFCCDISEDVWDVNQVLVRDLLGALIHESYRWDIVSLHIPLEAFFLLNPIRGNLPILSKINFGTPLIHHPPGFVMGDLYHLHYFSDAPKLRDAEIDTRNFMLLGEAGFQIDLPWSQLEKFTANGFRVTCYTDLALAQPSELRELDYTVIDRTPLPSSLTTLPKLQRLKFHLGVTNGTDISSHLDFLTLPSLTELEIRGRFVFTDALYDKVLALIRRSGCSLEYLALDPTSLSAPNVMSDIISLSPAITYLDVTNFDAAATTQLVLDPGSPSPPLPKLKTLILRYYDRGGVQGILDAAAATEVIKSRTKSLGAKHIDGEFFQALEEIEFVWEDEEDLYMQMLDFESTEMLASSAVEPGETGAAIVVNPAAGLDELASRSRRLLAEEFLVPWHRLRDYANVKLHLRMDKLVRDLENLDLKKHNSQPLTRRGVPRLLHQISQMPTAIIPGDRIFRFRSRAGKLVTKWKPFLLRDYQTSSCRWSYYDTGVVHLKFAFTHRDPKHEADIWSEILGMRYTPLPILFN